MNNKIYTKTVSDIITIDEIRNWQEGNTITINAGTGMGKSYFIKTKLYAFAESKGKKILILSNRKRLKQQYDAEIKKAKKGNVIDVMNYQALETLLAKGEEFNFDKYSYIVCDECHYFFTDSQFNNFTDLSLEKILSTKQSKIFMSATIDTIHNYIKNHKQIDVIEYKIPKTFNPVDTLFFYNKDETMIGRIKLFLEKSSKTKVILFCQSAKKGLEVYKEFKDNAMFVCANSPENKDLLKYVDKSKVDNLINTEKFEDRLLITTTCLDNGINIKDEDVKAIFVDVEDIDTVVQCIGRKRSQHLNDKIFVYVKNMSNQYIGSRKGQALKKIEMAEYRLSHTANKFCLKYPRPIDYAKIVYPAPMDTNLVDLKVNEIMYFRYKNNILLYDELLKDSNGYRLRIQCALNKEKYYNMEESEKQDELQKYLESIVGKKLYKEEQKKLIEKIDLRVDSKLQKSYSKLNDGLKMIKLPYIIIPKKSNSIRYWKIEKIE